MFVKNVKGSDEISKDPKKGNSWREFWEIQTGETIGDYYTCPACGKRVTKEHVDGCHVQKAYSIDLSWYIVPLCDGCNHRKDIFSIGDTTLTPVVYKD